MVGAGGGRRGRRDWLALVSILSKSRTEQDSRREVGRWEEQVPSSGSIRSSSSSTCGSL
jgi:hypothetical protein